MCSGLVQNMAGLVACRVLLGVLEAGFGAGVPYYLALCYKRRELGTRLSILLGSSPIANCIAGAMAYGITQIKSQLEPWRLIFLIGKFFPGPPLTGSLLTTMTKRGHLQYSWSLSCTLYSWTLLRPRSSLARKNEHSQ